MDKVFSSVVDSGERFEYESGAVRDMKSGKGRFDLLPFSVLLKVLETKEVYKRETLEVLSNISLFQHTGDTKYLYDVLQRFRLEDYEIVLGLARHYENGAVKYGVWNWTKGIPVWSYIDSAIRHLFKFNFGFDDEDHRSAFIWNIIGAIWTEENLPEYSYSKNLSNKTVNK